MEEKQFTEGQIRRNEILKQVNVATRWKKGQSGNPHGNEALSGPLKRATRQEVLAIFEQCGCITESQADERLSDPEISLLEKAMLTAVKRDIKKGDLYAIDRICDRILGKPKEKIDIEQKNEKLTIEFIDKEAGDNAGNGNTPGV